MEQNRVSLLGEGACEDKSQTMGGTSDEGEGGFIFIHKKMRRDFLRI